MALELNIEKMRLGLTYKFFFLFGITLKHGFSLRKKLQMSKWRVRKRGRDWKNNHSIMSGRSQMKCIEGSCNKKEEVL